LRTHKALFTVWPENDFRLSPYFLLCLSRMQVNFQYWTAKVQAHSHIQWENACFISLFCVAMVTVCCQGMLGT